MFFSKKISYFSLSFALSEYERRTLGAPVLLIYFLLQSEKKSPVFGLVLLEANMSGAPYPSTPPPFFVRKRFISESKSRKILLRWESFFDEIVKFR
jgi:hypothetical protein